MYRISLLGLATILGVAACATPNAKHVAFSQEAPRTTIGDAYDTYLLTKSIVTISRTKEGDKYVYAVGLALAGDTRNAFGIRAVDRFGVNTDIAITKIENTSLLQSVSVELEDKRIEYVGDAFKLLGTLAMSVTGSTAIFMAGPNARPFPLDVDTLERLTSASCERESCRLPLVPYGESDLVASLFVDEVPPDAMDLAHVLDGIESAHGVLFSSSCRRASVRFPTSDKTQWEVFKFSLADPRYVQIIPLPPKGTITFHGQCGFSVVGEKVELQSDAAVADAVLQEMQKLLKSLKKDSETEAEQGEGGQ